MSWVNGAKMYDTIHTRRYLYCICTSCARVEKKRIFVFIIVLVHRHRHSSPQPEKLPRYRHNVHRVLIITETEGMKAIKEKNAKDTELTWCCGCRHIYSIDRVE